MLSSVPKARIVTLGCPKNEVDSEEIAGVLATSGYAIDSQAPQSDLTIINTCGFLRASKDESIAAIREAVKAKKAGRTGKVIVAGCLSQRMGEELTKLIPEIDLCVGVGQMARFGEIAHQALSGTKPLLDIRSPHHRYAGVTTRIRTGAPWSAYLKIGEGCDHECAFCTIPSIRGPHQSKPIERLVAEAQSLAATGAVELNLIAQDVTQYGFDLYKSFTLPRLLRELSDVDGIEWLRILYFYPTRVTDELIETMVSHPKVLHYVDMPLQHSHPDVLKRMNRPWDGDRYLKLFEKMRKAMPDIAIRSTFIVGYPGETDVEFSHLLSFLRDAKLDRVGAFVYSHEAGTPSYDLPNQVPSRLKRARYDQLMRQQQKLSLEVNLKWIGRDLDVLIDSVKDGWCIGRSHRDAPEIDGFVYVQGEASPGEIVRVRIQRAEAYDLWGHRVP
jgi:ribosomal protein S12 methylthiotransferase